MIHQLINLVVLNFMAALMICDYGWRSLGVLILLRKLPHVVELEMHGQRFIGVRSQSFDRRARVYAGLGVLGLASVFGYAVTNIVRAFL